MMKVFEMADAKAANDRLDELAAFLKTSGLLVIAGSAIGFWLLSWLKGEAAELFQGLCCNLGFGWFALDEGWGAISVALIVAALPVSIFWLAKFFACRQRTKPPSMRELLARGVVALEAGLALHPVPPGGEKNQAAATAPLEPGHAAPPPSEPVAAEHHA